MLDLTGLEDDLIKTREVPPTVPGRVIHIDADFLAYMVSYDDTKSVLEMQHNCEQKILTLQLMAGAESYKLHLTPKESTKGDRYEIAIQKEYQGNRKGKEKPRYLHMIRNFMAAELGAKMCMTYEADDSMAMEAYAAAVAGTPELCVLATKDKDLRMIPGYQLDWDTGDIENTEDDFGYIKLVEVGKSKTKKVVGRGHKFFWAQLIMGDSADNIQGLPKITQPFVTGKPKSIGPVGTFDILQDIHCNKTAFALLKELFKSYEEEVGPFVHWDTGEEYNWSSVLISEMKLLWMRRKDDERDVLHWLSEETL